MKKFFIFLGIVSLLITSCESPYERKDGCTLDKLHMNGDVKELDVISLTVVPLTEMYEDTYDPQESLPIFSGNFKMCFDNNGNVKELTGFDWEGKSLFKKNYSSSSIPGNFTPAFYGAGKVEKIDDIQFVKDGKGNVCEAKFFQDGEPMWTMTMKYNDKGDVVQITKTYNNINNLFSNLQEFKFLHLKDYTDSTLIEYKDLDSLDNWTTAVVDYHGVFQKHNYIYTAKRYITYKDSKENKFDWDNLNIMIKSSQKEETCDYITETTPYFSIDIPNFMKKSSDSTIQSVQNGISSSNPSAHSLFMYEYNGNESYASFSAMISNAGNVNYDNFSSSDMVYDSKIDKMVEKQYREFLAQSNTYIVKWLPYEMTKLEGKNCSKISYFRYGKGSPMPVYVECYSLNVNISQIVNFTISYQSKDYYQFKNSFEHCKQSLSFK